MFGWIVDVENKILDVASYLLGVAAGWFNVHAAFVLYALARSFSLRHRSPSRRPIVSSTSDIRNMSIFASLGRKMAAP
jgi:hypothetical protein